MLSKPLAYHVQQLNTVSISIRTDELCVFAIFSESIRGLRSELLMFAHPTGWKRPSAIVFARGGIQISCNRRTQDLTASAVVGQSIERNEMEDLSMI